jgi:hypothetical protein
MPAEIASRRAQELADQYTKAIAALLAVVENCTESQWHTRCTNEARSVGVLVHHLATIATLGPQLINGMIGGDPPPPLTQEMIDHMNARHAADFSAVGQAETLALFRERSSAALDFIRGLNDAQLDLVAYLPVFGSAPTSVPQLIENLLIGHTLGHLASIQVALDL